MSNNYREKVGNAIRYFFKQANLTQNDVSEILGIAQPTVACILRRGFGKRSAERWSDAFGFCPGWLLTGDGDVFASEHPKIFEYKNGEEVKFSIDNSSVGGSVYGVVNNKNTYNAKKNIRENGGAELYESNSECLELENKLLKQRIVDLENIIHVKDDLIESLRETIRLMKEKIDKFGI